MSYCRFMSQETADRYNEPDSPYARFGPWQPSDLYIFDHVGGFITCCGCWLQQYSFETTDLQELLDHIAEHRAAGHAVHDGLEDLIREEWGPYG